MQEKLNISFGILLSLLALNGCGSGVKPSIVPLPQKIETQKGDFQLTSETKIVVDAASRANWPLLGSATPALFWSGLFRFSKAWIRAAKGNIVLTSKDAKPGLGPEGYELSVNPDSVVIRGEPAGIFYGVQSLLQLLAHGILQRLRCVQISPVPCVQIEDQPRFKWRGLMLDVARHFFTKDEVKQLLDALVLYKINTFHWHLTDDQGWRIEIKKYPRLTEVGAWRKGVGFGLDPKSTTAYGPDGRYGGFYTQDDIREVVAYAKERHITIVPEIEMPGHASAALAAYPQLSCTGGPFTPDLPGGHFRWRLLCRQRRIILLPPGCVVRSL